MASCSELVQNAFQVWLCTKFLVKLESFLMIPWKDQFGQRLEDEFPDRVEEEQAQVTDEVD